MVRSQIRINYGYGTKYNPFRNVLGFNLLLENNEEMFSPNNMTQDGGGFQLLISS